MATYNLRDGIPTEIKTGDILNYEYQSSADNTLQMTLPKGKYKLEVWGCGRHLNISGTDYGGRGGYAKGTVTLSASTVTFLTPGGPGSNGAKGSAGGGSDVRFLQNTVNHRAIVAGGGASFGIVIVAVGGGVTYTTVVSAPGLPNSDSNTYATVVQPEVHSAPLPAGNGGGTNGTTTGTSGRDGGAGTQNSGGYNGTGWGSSMTNKHGAFGQGGYILNQYGNVMGASGGGGWYGGGAGGLQNTGTTQQQTRMYGGAGGSGFVLTSSTAGYAPSGYALGSAYYLSDTQNSDGNTSITEPDGTTRAGHVGDGYVRITVVQGQLPEPTITGVSYPAHGTVRIAFTGVSGATAYKVYNGNGALLATITSSPYTETGIADGTQYTRKITAYSATLAESEPAVITFTSQSKLPAPTNLRASYTANSTTIQWNAVSGATNYVVTRNGASMGSLTNAQFVDYTAGAGTSYTYSIVAQASGRWDSDPASIATSNKPQLPNVTNLRGDQTVSSVTLSWTAAPNATGYDIYRDGVKIGHANGTSYTDGTTKPGGAYRFTVVSTANGYYDSPGVTVTVGINPQLETPALLEASQTQSSVTLNWNLRDYGAPITYTLRRDGTLIYQGQAKTYTDTGLLTGNTYTYTLVAAIPGSAYYDSNPAVLPTLVGRDMNTIDRQKDYLKSLRRPFTKLCRLRFLNPNGTTAFALDNNPRNKRSRTFIASGNVTGNLQNGQRMSATVTLDNADLAYETAVNKVWFGQEIALDEGLVLSDGSEYYRQTGVFLIDNPQEKIDPKTKTVTYRLLDKWAALDGTLGGNLDGTYEVPVGTNIFEPITALLLEDKGNGRLVDPVAPVYTEYYNGKTQQLTDGTTAYMTDSPYTLTVSGNGGTVAQVLLGLAGMVNAWIGYDNTGRLRIDPSQDDILDTEKPVLWRFNPEETQLLGMAYTVKKEDVYNDYIVVGEMLDDYEQPGGRATNTDPRSDTNIYLIGRKTKYESASGYATDTQCRDLAEWKLKRSSVLQKAVSISCSQMVHIDLNSLVEIVRTDKPGSPIERHLIQGFTRPLAYNGAMTITAVSVNDLPVATVTGPSENVCDGDSN